MDEYVCRYSTDQKFGTTQNYLSKFIKKANFTYLDKKIHLLCICKPLYEIQTISFCKHNKFICISFRNFATAWSLFWTVEKKFTYIYTLLPSKGSIQSRLMCE